MPVEQVLANWKLELSQEKTRITSFAAGFRFLGAEKVGKRLFYERGVGASWQPCPTKPDEKTKIAKIATFCASAIDNLGSVRMSHRRDAAEVVAR